MKNVVIISNFPTMQENKHCSLTKRQVGSGEREFKEYRF